MWKNRAVVYLKMRSKHSLMMVEKNHKRLSRANFPTEIQNKSLPNGCQMRHRCVNLLGTKKSILMSSYGQGLYQVPSEHL
jgi:hypothetical protein